MTNLFEKSVTLGLGAFVYSREKLEELVEELVNKGEVAKKDARQFAGELVKRGEEQRNELQKLIKDEVTETLNSVNVAKKEDLISKEDISRIVKEQIIQVLQEQGIVKGGNEKSS